MRYYQLNYPDGTEEQATNVKRLRGLPEGTTCYRMIWCGDDLAECENIPVVNGRVQIDREGVRAVSIWTGRRVVRG